MDVGVFGNTEWRELGRKFRGHTNGKEIRKRLTTAARKAAAPAVSDLRNAVQSIDSRGVKGRGMIRRERSYQVRTPRGRVRAFGLRATVARLVKTRIKYTGNSVGLRVFVDAAQMPNKQRRLPAHLDNPGGWRHPVWGHRTRRWAHQYGEPWFRRTLTRHTPLVRRELLGAVQQAMKELQ